MADRAPDLIAPLLGWRAWNIARTADGWRLHSVHMGDAWPVERPISASCHRGRWLSDAAAHGPHGHRAPARACQCGVYGAAGLETARQYFVASWAELEGLPPPPLADDYVPRAVGQVQLWGRVLECAQGYRAEHGYPNRIWIPARRPDGQAFDVESIALDLLDYGVAVELLDVATRAEISDRLPGERAA